MTEETYVQLFWALAFPTFILFALVAAASIPELFHTSEYRRYLKLQKAKAAWAKMLESINAAEKT